MTVENMENTRLFYKGVKIDIRTEEYIRKRLRAVEKLLNKILQIEVEIDLDKKGKFRTEVMIKTPYNLYRAEETTESIEGSIDLVGEELKKQIRRGMDKMRTLRRRGGRSIKKRVVVDSDARL
ncbi:sigma 54 modulation protein / S30EA ribosomal protein [bacterium BMS3Abin15]|nr:sigma 54 modulation protein / S30EA ribosomal protein [bacterium BMS3Abin15]HDZ85909.1 ribosome-associated translation inhibitor RaiA [Candidatus Moranbacteria bacterium]